MQLKKGNILTKVTRYHLQREEIDDVLIDIKEIINAGAKKNFVAHPAQIIPSARVSEEYVIYGDSEQEVLEELIKRIEDVKSMELFTKEKL